MAKIYRCCCQTGGHYSQKTVRNCYNKKKKQSAITSLPSQDRKDDSTLISSSFSNLELQSQTIDQKTEIIDRTLIHCHFARSLRDQSEIKQSSILQEINKTFWKDHERRFPEKGCRSSYRFISVINKRSELLEQLKHRFELYVDRKNNIPLNASLKDLRKNMFKRRRNYHYASVLFEKYVTEFEDRRQFGDIDKMTAQFEDLIKFLKKCSYKRFLSLLDRRNTIRQRIGAGIISQIQGFRKDLYKKFLKLFSAELKDNFKTIFLMYFHNTGDQITIDDFWRGRPRSQFKEFAEIHIAPRMKDFLEFHRLPIKEPLKDLPIDEAQLEKRKRNSVKIGCEPINNYLDVPQGKKGSGFHPFPGLKHPVPKSVSIFSEEEAAYFLSRVSVPTHSKYRSFSQRMMWKIKKLGTMTSKWLQYTFDKIRSQSKRKEEFLIERIAQKKRCYRKSKKWACQIWQSYIQSHSYLSLAWIEIFFFSKTKKDKIECFTSVAQEIDHRLWQFKKQFDQYCSNGKRDAIFLKKLDLLDKKEQFQFILKKCCICNAQFTYDDNKRVKCLHCSTQFHQKCSSNLNNCLCQRISFQMQRIFDEKQFEQQYQSLLVWENELLRRKHIQGITIFKTKTKRQIIEAEQENIKQALNERDRFIYSSTAKIHKRFSKIKVDRNCDPFLGEADQKLTEAYRSYACGSYKVPLKLKVHCQDNFGIQALEALPKLILLGQYAADIVPTIYCSQMKWKDHLMIYYQGTTSKEELMLVPFNICNFGPLLNHSAQGNCSSLRVIIDHSIRVLLFTTKKVKMGEQLLYNYNGFHQQYPTDGFKKL